MNELATVDIPEMEILAAGKWNGHPKPIELTQKDLQAIVDSFTELSQGSNYEPPVKLGHDDGQKLLQTDGYPAAGWVKGLQIKGGKLVASIKDVPAKLAEIINAGGYRKVSAEINSNYKLGDKTYPWVLKAVSILGADIPAVKSISDIAALYHEQDSGSIFVFYEGESKVLADYPWDECIAEQMDRYGDEETAKKVCAMIKNKYGAIEKAELTAALTAIETETGIKPKATEAPATSNATEKATEAPATSAADDKTIKETEVAMNIELETQLRTLLGLDEAGDILAAVTALKKKADAELTSLTEKASIQTKLTETETKLSEAVTKEKAATTKLAEIERDGRVSKAMKAGKIVPAQKAWADQYALTDPAGFDAFVLAAAPVIDLTENGAEGGDPNETQLTETEISTAKSMGVDLDTLKKSKAAEAAKSKK